MKKSVLTFCTVLLLATQAPVANAEEVSGKAKVNYFQSVSEYRLKVNALFKMQWSVKKVVETEQTAPKETIVEVKQPVVEEVTKQPTYTAPKETTEQTKQEAPKAPTQEVKPEAPKAPTQEVKPEAPKAPTQEVKPEAPKAPTQEVKPEAPKAPTQEVKQEAPKAPTQEVKQEAPKAPTESVTKAEPVKQVTPSASEIDVIEQQVVELTNKEREKYSLPALAMDKPLMAAAREKSKDMQVNNYFSHTSPTYGSPFDRMKALGISYKTAGENIAKGQTSAAQVVEAWMNSEGHRANILNKDFTHIGVGYVKQGHVWTQQFIKK